MKKAIEFIIYLIGILYLPTIAIISFFTDQSGSFFEFSPLFIMLLLWLMTFHFFCVFMEIGFTVLRMLEKKECTLSEKIMNISTLSVAAVILILAVIAPDSIDLVAIILSGILVVLWIVGDIVFKQRKFSPDVFKEKAFWLSALALLTVIAVFFAATGGNFESGKPDPNEPLPLTEQTGE